MTLGRKTGGRQKGTPNKATTKVRELTGEHGPAAVGVLVEIMTRGTTEASRLAAAREVLDRPYGRPAICAETDDDLFAPIDFAALSVARPDATRRARTKRKCVPVTAQPDRHDDGDEAGNA